MGWFIKDKEETTSRKKERQIQDMLLGFALESYKNKNFTTGFNSDYDRRDKEYKANFQDIVNWQKGDCELKKLKHLENGPFIIINRNQSISYDYPHGAYKSGGINFTIYTRNDEGHIIVYKYNNINCNYDGVDSKLELYMNVYNGHYSGHDYEPDYTFDRRWSDYNTDTSVEIHRMKKLEKLIILMVDEQEVDSHARNEGNMDKLLGFMPKKSKRDKILKELLKNEE